MEAAHMKTARGITAGLTAAVMIAGPMAIAPVSADMPSAGIEIDGLLPDEVNRLVSAEEMVYAEEEALAFALSRPGFAGWHFDPIQGAVFSYTQDVPEVPGKFSTPALVTVRVVEFSLDDLEQHMAALENLRPFIVDNGGQLEYVGISETDNVVRAGISGSSASSSDTVIDRVLEEIPDNVLDAYDLYGSEDVKTIARTGVESGNKALILGQQVCTNRASCSPFRSGIELDNLNAFAACTSGFVSERGGNRGLMTNGHCGDVGDDFYNGGVSIGEMKVSFEGFRLEGYVDAGWVDESKLFVETNPVIYVLPNDKEHKITKVHRTYTQTINGTVRTLEAPREGESICIAGITSNYHCGRVGGRYNYGEGHWAQPCASYSSVDGDSGAGVFSGTTAKGLNWGHSTDANGNPAGPPECAPTFALFTPIARAEAATGATVLLSSAGQD